jgi:hypothetical protein
MLAAGKLTTGVLAEAAIDGAGREFASVAGLLVGAPSSRAKTLRPRLRLRRLLPLVFGCDPLSSPTGAKTAPPPARETSAPFDGNGKAPDAPASGAPAPVSRSSTLLSFDAPREP